MRGALLWIVTLIAGCAPDYGHTAFLCGPGHDCPPGQDCVAGRCRRGPPTGDGVACGAMTCGVGQQCCVDRFAPAQSCLAAGEICPGTGALCDGAEDCQTGDRCCADGDTMFCDATCRDYACQDDADCPSTAHSCCPDAAMPWGRCSRLGC